MTTKMPLNISRNTSLKVKFAVFTAISTALIFLFLVIYVGRSQRIVAYTESKTLALEVSRKASLETEKFFSTPFEITRELSRSFEVLKDNKIERSTLSEILKKTLQENNDFLAIWLLWEPNAYDNKDRLYANTEHYDSTGTFLITYFRQNDLIRIEKNDIIDLQEDYYTVPKKRRQEVLIDPYNYQYRGYKEIYYETSVVVPLIYNQKFYGVVAVDINLKNLQDKFKSFNVYETGYVSLISNSGIIVSHPDSSFMKKNINDLLEKSETLNFNSLFASQEKSYETTSEFTGKKVFRIIYPIKIGKTGLPWFTLVEIPLNEITKTSDQLLLTSLIILIIGLSLLIYLTINILERRKYEKALIHAKLKAEESDKLKTSFLCNISHEIRTPMNGIIGFTDLIAQKDTIEENRQLYKELIQNSCNQLLFIINDVLDISAIETGQVSLKISSVPLDELVSKLKAFFDPLAREKKLELTTRTSNKSRISIIETDGFKLFQILTNLINNGIKFTEVGSVEFGYEMDDQKITFFVRDTGIGIQPDNRETIFDRFRQEDNTLNRKYKGTGLGLSICKAYTEMMNGKIWFEPNKTKGTTFYLTIPCKPTKQ